MDGIAVEGWRDPSAWERQLLEKLCTAPTAHGYAAQIPGIQVRFVASGDQLELRPGTERPRVSAGRMFISEGSYIDEDGLTVSLLLHARDGRLRLLEVLKNPAAVVLNKEPDLETVEVLAARP